MGCGILIDAGTTNVRVTLLNSDGQAADVYREEAGVRHTAIDGDNHRLKAALKNGIEALLAKNKLDPSQIESCIAYGMITSNVGLMEIPHCVAPIDRHGLHQAMVSRRFEDVAPFPMTFIPGVRNRREAVTLENLDAQDMMRGEETEAVGLYKLIGKAEPCLLVLPGSHNKFIAMDGRGAILGCMTSISGELLDALTFHTILSEAVEHRFVAPEGYDRALALAGARAYELGMGRAAFMGRILRTLGGYTAQQSANFLLGVAMGMDRQALAHFISGFGLERPVVYVAGKEPVNLAFRDVAEALGGWESRLVPAALSARMGAEGALAVYRDA